jgi:hypothetical protein
MKLTKKSRIAGYYAEICIKSDSGKHIKTISSTSGVDQAQAEQNVMKRAYHFAKQAIRWFDSSERKHYIDEFSQRLIKQERLTRKDFEQMVKKLEPMVKTIYKNDKEVEI